MTHLIADLPMREVQDHFQSHERHRNLRTSFENQAVDDFPACVRNL